MRLIIIAPPGAGKTTQSRILEVNYNLKRISTGEIFRDYFKDHTSWYDYTKTQFENGILCSDELTNDLVNRYLPKDNYLLDGYPRTLPQAEYFNDKLKGSYRPIHIIVDKKVLIERLLSRSLKETRTDNNGGVIQSRLEIYEKQTEPLIPYYRKLGILIEQDGNEKIENISSQLMQKINSSYSL